MLSKKYMLIVIKLFCLCRYFFSLGQDQEKICNDLGGEIDVFKPVGSLFMESVGSNKKRI